MKLKRNRHRANGNLVAQVQCPVGQLYGELDGVGNRAADDGADAQGKHTINRLVAGVGL